MNPKLHCCFILHAESSYSSSLFDPFALSSLSFPATICKCFISGPTSSPQWASGYRLGILAGFVFGWIVAGIILKSRRWTSVRSFLQVAKNQNRCLATPFKEVWDQGEKEKDGLAMGLLDENGDDLFITRGFKVGTTLQQARWKGSFDSASMCGKEQQTFVLWYLDF